MNENEHVTARDKATAFLLGNPESELGDKPDTGFMAHLLELRNRLLRSVGVVLVVFIGMFPFANDIYTFVSKPLRVYLPEGAGMIATQVASPFLTPFKLTFMMAVFLAIPYILHQAWAFISPGLYKHEKRIAVPLLASSVVLFYGGMAFAYYVVFPLVFGFFTSVGPEGVTVMTDIGSYLDFVLKLFFAFGIAFEIPIAAFLMIWTGMTTVEKLSEKRPYIVVGCFVVGMFLTPPDVISQSLLAIPMWMLFEIGILFGRFVKKDPEDANDENDDDTDDDASEEASEDKESL